MDVARLKELIQLMDRNQLAELEVEGEDFKVRLRKKEESVREVVSVPAMGMAPMAAPPAGAAAGAAAPAGDATDAIPEENLIRAPMVGTFYRSPSPESDPFVETGDKVEEGQTICIIEAMKVMNEVKEERSGTIEAALTDNGEPVEFGTPLFRIS